MPHLIPDWVVEVCLWLTGLCVGSFLNVVVYRLPLELSIRKPARSFCPRCRADIAWYDNVPVLSWFLLLGRCRNCRASISVQYPLIEALTGLAFVLVYHLLFVVPSRNGVSAPELPTDLPLLLTWLVLVSGLVACAAMDVLSYSLDVRVTLVVLGSGILLHALWPRPDFFTRLAGSATGAAAAGAALISLIWLWWSIWRQTRGDEEPAPPEPSPATGPLPATPAAVRMAAAGGVAVFVLVAAWLVYLTGAGAVLVRPDTVVAVALLAIFAAVVLAGGQQRAADHEIHAAIEEERPQARRMVLRELKWLLPAVLAAAGALAWVTHQPDVAKSWTSAVSWSPIEGFAPLGGAVFAIHGAIVGAAVGWLLRIVFTLVFGREAFGVGDIYILAAAGAAVGGDIAVLGLLLSVGIALLGWLLGLLLKSTVMIPFGPWLAIGFLLALWWNVPAADRFRNYATELAYSWRLQPYLILVGVGVLLVGAAAGIVLARLVRRWVERDGSPAGPG